MCTSLHVSTFSDTIVTIVGATIAEVENFMIQGTEFISEKVTREPHVREILGGNMKHMWMYVHMRKVCLT